MPNITIINRCVALGAQILPKFDDDVAFIVDRGHGQLGKGAEGGFSEGRFANVSGSGKRETNVTLC